MLLRKVSLVHKASYMWAYMPPKIISYLDSCQARNTYLANEKDGQKLKYQDIMMMILLCLNDDGDDDDGVKQYNATHLHWFLP